MERITHRPAIAGVIGCLLAAISGCASTTDAAPVTPTPARPLTAPMLVTTVTDGDTIRVRDIDGKATVVRLLGIDAPETKDRRKPVQCYGPEASAHLKQTLTGRTVQLEPGAEPVDKYGRTLAYIWLDNQLVNYQLVAAGYAREYTYNPRQPGAHAPAIRTAQQDARTTGRGLWAPHGCNGRT